MKKFVEVFVGSRGCLEEVNLVETKLSLNEHYQELVDSILSDFKDSCDDEEELEFMSEFVGIEDYEGFSVVGLNEEESLFVFDFDVNKDKVISEIERRRAKLIARKPEEIGNFVYANQNGNGNEDENEDKSDELIDSVEAERNEKIGQTQIYDIITSKKPDWQSIIAESWRTAGVGARTAYGCPL